MDSRAADRRREPSYAIQYNVRDRRDDDMYERVVNEDEEEPLCLATVENYKRCLVMVSICVINIAIAYMLTSESKSVRVYLYRDQ